MKTQVKLFLFALLTLFTLRAEAQLQNYQFGIGTRIKKMGNEPTGWNMQQNILCITMRGHVSLVDFIFNRDGDNRFRFGDYLGGGFGTGYAKEQINPNGEIGAPGTRKLGTMWISLDFQFGLQASYAFNEKLRVGVSAFKEFQFGFVIMTDYSENIYTYNMLSANVTYGNLFLEYNHGLPWDLTDAEDYDDHVSRIQFRYFLDREKGSNIGFRLDVATRKWYGGRTDRLTGIEFCFGRMF
jgi:hypothetical protein